MEPVVVQLRHAMAFGIPPVVVVSILLVFGPIQMGELVLTIMEFIGLK